MPHPLRLSAPAMPCSPRHLAAALLAGALLSIGLPAGADRVADPDAYRAWDAYRPNPRYEPIRIPDYVIENIRRAEQEAAESAQRRTLGARPPAPAGKPRDPAAEAAAEAAAWAFWEAESVRLAEQKKLEADQLRRLRSNRLAVIARMQAAAGELAARGAMTPDDFDRLVSLSVPEWDWMSYWAEEGYRAYPREFALRRAVVMTIGCPEVSYLEYRRMSKRCAPARLEQGLAAIEAASRDGNGNPLDRLLACGFLYGWLGRLDRYAYTTAWQATQPGRPYAAEFEKSRALEAAVAARAQQCDAALQPIPDSLRDSVLGQMWRSGFDLFDDQTNVTTRWFVVSAEAWRGVSSLADRQQVAAVIEQAPKRFNGYRYQFED